jgi:hypothetical protein
LCEIIFPWFTLFDGAVNEKNELNKYRILTHKVMRFCGAIQLKMKKLNNGVMTINLSSYKIITAPLRRPQKRQNPKRDFALMQAN